MLVQADQQSQHHLVTLVGLLQVQLQCFVSGSGFELMLLIAAGRKG